MFLISFVTSCSTEVNSENEGISNEHKAQDSLQDKIANLRSIKSSESLKSPKLPKEPCAELLTDSTAMKELAAYGQIHSENVVIIKTSLGNMTFKLFDDTPLHRANFIMLAKKGYFNETSFYRVIKGFMIQGGNSESENTFLKMARIGDYKISPEIKPNHFHRKGALALAVSENEDLTSEEADWRSSPYNFYVVHGTVKSKKYLKAFEKQKEVEIPENRKKVYSTAGGAWHLDGKYTVFGQLSNGFEVLDKIANIEVDRYNWPVKDVKILSVEIAN